MRARLAAVNVVHELIRGPSRWTAIDKRPVEGLVRVGALGLAGDTQCDTRHHGGPDKAVYVYAAEDLAWWAADLERGLLPGAFGDNLTTAGLDVTGAVIGERWRIGPRRTGCVLEVTLPRTPCSNLSARMDIPRFHLRFAAEGRVGAYTRVLSEGSVSSGSRITLEHRPDHGVTVRDVATGASPEQLRSLLDSGVDLAQPLRAVAQRRQSRRRA